MAATQNGSRRRANEPDMCGRGKGGWRLQMPSEETASTDKPRSAEGLASNPKACPTPGSHHLRDYGPGGPSPPRPGFPWRPRHPPRSACPTQRRRAQRRACMADGGGRLLAHRSPRTPDSARTPPKTWRLAPWPAPTACPVDCTTQRRIAQRRACITYRTSGLTALRP